nr:MAG TPA: putative ligand binding protein [Caudoviricetes sp.]
MARIKIDKTTVCDKDYYNIELLGVFLENVVIVGGGYTKEEAMADIKAEAQTWLEYEIKEAKVEQYCYGRLVALSDKEVQDGENKG